ncbi:glycosyltransferase family 4 protein [Gelidibacter salicanalis]|uniref:Glycosyltransferase family 4 protein n=1 Tax=Gelidibacter salicanalis TaxID=291193 RepID=A0A5C7ANM1_9FLAO|nr:glycosyltransferase family 4 protein [Gelidibacter salicanalis]TXE09279.1 glycosyltransferase family 4 protein [Gelidibacter salicanalis]
MTQYKLLFVLESFFPDHRAGTEVYVLNLCKYFSARNWPVAVLIATTSNQKDYIYEGFPVHTFPIPKKPDVKELNGLMPPKGIKDFLDRVNEIKPDVVHFHSFGRAINGFHLKRIKHLGYKTLYTPHLGSLFCIKGNMRLFDRENCDGHVEVNRCMSCLLYSKGYNLAVSKVMGAGISMVAEVHPLSNIIPPTWQQASHRKSELDRISNYADIIFAIAPWIQKAFVSNSINNSILIPQGISSVFFQSEKNVNKPCSKEINFVFVGRMHPSKGFHLLKQAWDELDGGNHKLHIITNPSGNENDYFSAHKIWANQKSSVVWNEGFSQEQVADYLNSMSVLILPSISNEVAPLVILEAATRKIPVISSNYIAMIDVILNMKNGLLFENGDWEALLDQIKKLIVNPKLIDQLSDNVNVPATMDEVAEIIELEILKIFRPSLF